MTEKEREALELKNAEPQRTQRDLQDNEKLYSFEFTDGAFWETVRKFYEPRLMTLEEARLELGISDVATS